MMISATRSSQRLAMITVQAMLMTALLAGCATASKLAGKASADSDSDGNTALANNQPAASASHHSGNRYAEAPGYASDGHQPDQNVTSTTTAFAVPASDRGQQFQLASARTSLPALSTLAAHENLDARLAAAPGLVLVDFYADWCGPCRRQGKILHDLEAEAAKYNATIIKVDIEAHPQLAQRFDATRLPTLVALRNGQIVQRQTGLASAEQVTAMLRK